MVQVCFMEYSLRNTLEYNKIYLELPRLRGFSEESIRKMRVFSEFWTQYLNRSPLATDLNATTEMSVVVCDTFSLAKWSPTASETYGSGHLQDNCRYARKYAAHSARH